MTSKNRTLTPVLRTPVLRFQLLAWLCHGVIKSRICGIIVYFIFFSAIGLHPDSSQAIERQFVLRMQEETFADRLSQRALEGLFVGIRHDAIDVAWSPNGGALAIIDSYGHLAIWRDEGKKRQEYISSIAGGGDCLAFVDHGRALLTEANWGLVKIKSPAPANVAFTVWDVETGSLLRLVDRPAEIFGKPATLRHCTVSSDERLMAVIAESMPYSIAVYSTSDWKVQCMIHLPLKSPGIFVPEALAFSPDNRMLAIGAADRIFLVSLGDHSQTLDVITPYDGPKNAGMGAQIHALVHRVIQMVQAGA